MFTDHIPDTGAIGAHRGVRSLAPENTLLALAMSGQCGAHFLETDVQLTKDGELVIFHDDTLARTTDIATIKKQGNKEWDVIIIGGGATDLGTALDAASRGYTTLLLEQSDFSKRYLEPFNKTCSWRGAIPCSGGCFACS